MQDDVVALFAYDRWANTKVLDAKPRAEGSAARSTDAEKKDRRADASKRPRITAQEMQNLG
jgi:hypothetical protein